VQFTIREFRPDDFPALWRLDQECFEPGISYSRAELMHFIYARGAFTLVAEQTGQGQADSPGSSHKNVMGFIVAEKDRRNLGHIITIDIGEPARRHGIGSRLMGQAEQRLRQAGCTAVYLETAVNNGGAIRFYKRLGCFLMNTIPRYYQGKIDALVMGKQLM